MRDLHLAGDGTLAVYGQGDGGIIQTEGGLVSEDGPGGYLTIFDSTLQEIRYSTRLPGTGKVRRFMRTAVAEHSYAAIAHRMVNGKLRVLCVTSADENAQEAVSQNAVQKTFGGGEWDGFFVVLEGEQDPGNTISSTETEPDVSPGIQHASPPETDTRFVLNNEYPPFDNVSMAIRDKNGEYLPNLFWGYFAEKQSFDWNNSANLGTVNVVSRKMTNRGGLPSRRILGSLAENHNNKLSLSAQLDIQGVPELNGDVFVATSNGTLTIEERSTSMSGTVTISPVYTAARYWERREDLPDNAPPPEKRYALHYKYVLECNAEDLGIADGGRGVLEVTIDLFAYPSENVGVSPVPVSSAEMTRRASVGRVLYDVRGRRINLEMQPGDNTGWTRSLAKSGNHVPMGVYISERKGVHRKCSVKLFVR